MITFMRGTLNYRRYHQFNEPTSAAIMAAATLGSGAMNYFGNQSAMNKQIQMSGDQFRQNQRVSDSLLTSMPGLMSMFNQYAPNPSDYFSPGKINTYYDTASSNLGRNMTGQVAGAQGSAAAMAGARGFANPGGFVSNAGQNVRTAFMPQFGQLEQGRAGALMSNDQNYYQALMSLLGQRLNLGQQEFQNRQSALSPITFGG